MSPRKPLKKTFIASATALAGAGLFAAPAHAEVPIVPVESLDVHGAIGNAYNANGGALLYGDLKTNEIPIGNGAVEQIFTGGTFYWSAQTGAHFVKNTSEIASGYAQQAAQLGLPTSDESCTTAVPGSVLECEQTFQNGALTYNDYLGLQTVEGPIYQAWYENPTPLAAGGTVGDMTPISEVTAVGDGYQQNFALPDGGTGTFYSSSAGTYFVDAGTAAGQFFINSGGAARLGFPTSAVETGENGVSIVQTTQGTVVAQFLGSGVQGQMITGATS